MDNLEPAMPAVPPEPMRLLLSTIAQGCHEDVPHTLSVRELFEIVELASRENMIATLRPWLQRWIDSLALTGVGPETCDLLGFVTWEIGHLRIYENVVRHLAMRCAVDKESNLLHPETGHVLRLERSASTGIYDHVLQTRRRGIRRMLFKLASAIQDCFDRPVCRQGDRIVCPCTVFSSVTDAYEAAGIDWKAFRMGGYPDYRESFQDLVYSIMRMEYENAAGHDCNPIPSIQDSVDDVWIGTAMLLTSEQDDHFWSRALVSGCQEDLDDSWTEDDSDSSIGSSYSFTDRVSFTVAPSGQQGGFVR